MATSTSTKIRGRGRPQLYPLTSVQIRSITSRLNKGVKPSTIATELDVHPYAVLRVKRSLNS